MNIKPADILLVFAFIALVATAVFCDSACSNLSSAQQAALTTLENQALSDVAQYASTGNINYAQAIPLALDSIAVYSPSTTVSTAALSTAIQTAVSDFTNGTGQSTGQKLAQAVLTVLPAVPTGAQVNAALTSASAGASAGANP